MQRVEVEDLAIEFELRDKPPKDRWDLEFATGYFKLTQNGNMLFDGPIEVCDLAAGCYFWALKLNPARTFFRFGHPDDDNHGYRATILMLREDEAGMHFDWELDDEPFPANTVIEQAVRKLFVKFACELRKLVFEEWSIDYLSIYGKEWESGPLPQVKTLVPLQGCASD